MDDIEWDLKTKINKLDPNKMKRVRINLDIYPKRIGNFSFDKM